MMGKTRDKPDSRSLFENQLKEPLAARMRPATPREVLGQDHLLGEGCALRNAIDRGEIPSMILWGPPGSGKTTIGRLIANTAARHFEPFSAVTQGIPRVREIIDEAQKRIHREGRGTILFCDEIHRFNKAQQDAFLPWVEEGVITLVGATTENPSFEVNSALLSRVHVYVLRSLEAEHIAILVQRAFDHEADPSRTWTVDPAALQMFVRYADGDARRAINAVEQVIEELATTGDGSVGVSATRLESILARRMPRYDKSGEEHFNLISALHKAVRGSDVEGALYWLARMIGAGEEILYIARRVVRMAVEDIGLADPRALSVAVAAKDAYHFLGSPEGDLAVAEAVVYLATAPKSNKVYTAWAEATRAAQEHPNEPVPLHIRNAPTGLMKDLGYGKEYRYDHDEGGLAAGQEYLPDPLHGSRWYTPEDVGFEKTIRERLEWWRKQREPE
jgi:putative ATPase